MKPSRLAYGGRQRVRQWLNIGTRASYFRKIRF